MYSKCDHCGEFAVDDSENIEVCKSCGIVVEETKLSSTDAFSSYRPTFTPYSKSEARLHHRKKKPLSLLHGISVIDNLCHVNSISSVLKAEITELFKLIVSIRHFKQKEDAGATAACCVFLVQRKNKQAIAITTLCKQLQCTKGKFSYFLKYVKSCLSSNDNFKQYSFLLENEASEGPEKDAESDVSDVVASLIRVVCDKAEKTEKVQLMEKTAALVKLAESCWLLTGRSPRSVVVASAYLCWKSMHAYRMKASFPTFCSEFEIREPVAKLRIPELKALLLKLGKKIPSYSKNYVNRGNLLFHLSTILENSESLRNDLFPDLLTREQVDKVEFSNFRLPPCSIPRKEPTTAVHYDSDMNASDIEISDSEIESYLISDNKRKVLELCEKNNSKCSD